MRTVSTSALPESKHPDSPPGSRKPGQHSAKKAAELEDRAAAMSVAEQKSIMFNCATVSDLEVIFGHDRRTIQKKLIDLPPTGTRRGAPAWRIRDAAPYLVRPKGDLAEFARTARPQDMPPNTLKEFWNGQRAKQAFLLEEGLLWRTDAVQTHLAEVFKILRTQLLLIPDELELKTSLTDIQREEVGRILDGALEDLRVSLIAIFSREPGPGEGPGTEEPELDDPFYVPPHLLSEPEEDEDERPTADEPEDPFGGI